MRLSRLAILSPNIPNETVCRPIPRTSQTAIGEPAFGHKKELCMRITQRIAGRIGRVLAAVALFSPFAGFSEDVVPVSLSAAATGIVQETGNRKGTVWVVNRDQGTMMIFDADSGAPLLPKPLPVGRGAHDICISERAGKAYITAETDNVVTAVDVETLALESIAVGPLPHHIEPSHDGRFVYVTLASHTTAFGSPQYAVIDTSDHSVTYTTTSANPSARSHAVYPTPDGETVYVAHDVGNEVSAIAAATGEIVFSTATIDPPQAIARAEEVIPTRFGNQLWVAARGDGSVKRIDLEFPHAITSITVGVQPESVMLTPSERTLLVSSRGSPASLAFVDPVRATLLRTVQIAAAGTFGNLAVISDDGRYVYATYDALAGGTGGVAVVDVRTQAVVKTWEYPGAGRPHGVWYSRKTR
jgi:DNA-binding beta-propeller fold protein YncE